MIYSKRLYKPLFDEEVERKELKELKKFELEEKIRELIDGDDLDLVTMNW